MDEQIRKDLERATYNRTRNQERPAFGSFWSPRLYEAMMGSEFEPELERLAQQHLTGRKVLILGAGASEVQLAQRYTDRIWALNISEKAVLDVQRAYPSVHSFVADAERLDAIEERFDAVYCKSILHHLHPIEGVLASIARRLSPGGILFVAMEPGLYNPFAAFARRFTPSQSHTPGERPFVFSEFSRLSRARFDALYENHHFLCSLLLPALAKRAPVLEPVLQAALAPTLSVERGLRKLPFAANLYWVMTGVYRVR